MSEASSFVCGVVALPPILASLSEGTPLGFSCKPSLTSRKMPCSNTMMARVDYGTLHVGYHVYKKSWEAAFGEELECKRKPSKLKDQYAVAVIREGNIVGHLP